MKAICKIDLLKAIAFMVVVLFFTACNPDEDPIALKPIVTIGTAENITTTSATLVATVVPNGDDVTVFFSYKVSGSSSVWTTANVTTKFSGNTSSKVTVDVTGLQPNTKYDFKADAGYVSSEVSTFTTGLAPVAKIGIAKDVKISTAKLTATVVPYSTNVPVSFEYQTTGSTWISKPITANFSGTDSIKVTLDLSDLQANTVYKFRLKAGNTVSDESTFWTYDFADADGNLYHSVKIGTQTWSVENLKVTHYRNGDPIAHPTANSNWANLTSGAYCNYNNSDSLAQKFGRLYNWYAVTDTRKIAPAGWHVPNLEESGVLYSYVGKLYNLGEFCYLSGPHLMTTTEWNNPKPGVYGPVDNGTGFTGLPSGYFGKDPTGLWKFMELHESLNIWLNAEYGVLSSNLDIQLSGCILSNAGLAPKTFGLSVRLIKDN